MLALAQVDHDDPRLDRLLQLYMFEWSALVATPIGPDARYHYADLVDYADRARHAAYLFVEEALPIGFALIARDDAGAWHVEEFFVIAGVRRRGLGRLAAAHLLASQPGPWTWTVRPENPGALAFWRRVAPAADVVDEPGTDGVTRARMSLVAPPRSS